MNVKRLFVAAGIAWGIVLGIAGGIYAGGIAAGFAWLFLFGDDSWPGWSEAAIMGVAVAAGLAILVGCTALGWAVGRGYETAGSSRRSRGGRIAAGLVLLAVLAGAGGVWSVARQQDGIDRQRREQADEAVKLAELQAATHRFAGIDIDWQGGGADGSAVLHIDGGRTGAYRLEWHIRGQSFRKPLIAGEERLELAPGRTGTNIQIPAAALVDGYRAILSHQNANIMVDEPFTLEARLTPILSAAEDAVLPQGERHNLEQGWSKLIDEASAEFPVRFFLYGGALSWQAR
ncbi:MAG: hypothetical protein IMF05_14795 [Proteobacteria bacterium]|nr:hypothetical protein [Pseudomonadota bacterium]